ncbi:methyltransferase domain-containing protein [Bacillus tianshenii]|nr:methyltransferase domain-containing protein [Bacillus tianshenii]
MKQNVKDIWDAGLYDESHSFVSKFGNDLVELLAPTTGEQILDLGCGTGDLANTIYDYEADVKGVDKSANMVKEASKKFPHIKFEVEDVLELEYKKEFDAVFSNATLHWVKEAKQALRCIYSSLKSGGRFVAEFGGKGNVQIITNEIVNQLKLAGIEYTSEQFPWYFPSIGEYSSLMEETGFRVTFAQHFDRPTPLEGNNGLKNWIEMFAGNMFEDKSEATKEQVIKNVENNLRDILFIDGRWIADYKRIRVVGMKE